LHGLKWRWVHEPSGATSKWTLTKPIIQEKKSEKFFLSVNKSFKAIKAASIIGGFFDMMESLILVS
jgi:hypothetical protein